MKEEPGVAGRFAGKCSVTAGSMAKEKKISVEKWTGTPGSRMTFLRLLLQRPPFRRSRRRIIKK
jgi:hypothetical protein